MPLDPQVQTVLDQFRSINVAQFSDLGLEGARKLLDDLAEATPAEPVEAVDDRRIPGPAGEIPVRVYRPAGPPGPLPVVVFFHGGGFVLGTLTSHDRSCRALANRAGCLVVAVDYRLAPEHPFPAGVEDALAATGWVATHAADLAADPDRLGVAGDSAGGNLAAVVCHFARERGGPRIRHQLLVYPTVDLTGGDWPSYREFGEGYLLTRQDMLWFMSLYFEPGADRRDLRASPLLAASHAGLPPATILTAEFDPLRDEGEAYGERLRAAGVPVSVHRYEGQIHGFLGMTVAVERAARALDEGAAEVREALAMRPAATA